MAKKKKAAEAAPSGPSDTFFQKQLQGEEPLTLATARVLYSLAMDIAAIQPWTFMADTNLVLVADPNSGETCYCSVMGALGEVFSIHAYVGEAGYRLLRGIMEGIPMTSGEFLASNRSVLVEFEMPSLLTPPDRELLSAMGHPNRRGARPPYFRAFRPGYHPWYVTEPEARTLVECLEGMIAFLKILKEEPEAPYWAYQDIYPYMVGRVDTAGVKQFELRAHSAPLPPAPALVLPSLDDARIRLIQSKDYALRGKLQADYALTPTVVGEKNERKASASMALVADAKDGYLFPPHMAGPDQTPGDVLANAILKAIETGNFLPLEIQVSQQDYKTLLDPLARQLGFTVKVLKSIPAVERAKEHLFEWMGGSQM